VPVPAAVDLDALNAQLLASCRADEARVIHPRTHTAGEAVTIERASLRPLADDYVQETMDLAESNISRGAADRRLAGGRIVADRYRP